MGINDLFGFIVTALVLVPTMFIGVAYHVGAGKNSVRIGLHVLGWYVGILRFRPICRFNHDSGQWDRDGSFVISRARWLS